MTDPAADPAPHPAYRLTLTCAEQPGSVAAVSAAISALGGNILETNQYRDPETNCFFMRVAFEAAGFAGSDAVRLRLARSSPPTTSTPGSPRRAASRRSS